MRNIWSLFQNDLRHVASDVVVMVMLIGVVTIPAFGAWFNILAAWDIFGNASNLSVAVASKDAGFVTEVGSVELNVGEDVLASLHDDDALQWVFTDEAEAIEGVEAGRYYAAVVIPEDFSENILSVLAGKPVAASLDYYSNHKKSVIAKKVIDQESDEVAQAVNNAFSRDIARVTLDASAALLELYDEEGADAYRESLDSHVGALASQLRSSASLLRSYGTFLASSHDLLSQSGSLMEGMNGTLAAMREGSGELASDGRVLSAEFDGALGAASSSFADAESTLSQVQADVDEYYDAALAVAERLESALEEAKASVPAESAPQFSLGRLKTKLEGGRGQADRLLDKSEDALASARRLYEGGLRPSVRGVSGAITRADGAVAATADDLGGILDEVSFTAQTLSDDVGGTCAGLSAAADRLNAVADSLEALRDDIEALFTEEDLDLLRALTAPGSTAMADALAAPVELDRHGLYPSSNFGSAMTPLYSLLPLWIGTVIIMVTYNVFPTERDIKRLDNPTFRELFIGRFGIVAVVSLMQSTVMALGFLLFLQVQVDLPPLFLLTFWVAGVAYSMIIYTLVVLFMSLGKAICVLLLVTQVSGAGGSFPAAMLPEAFQVVGPFLPVTHAINALREAMFGMYGAVYWQELGLLLLIAGVFLLLGLAPRGLVDRFIKWLFGAVGKTKLM